MKCFLAAPDSQSLLSEERPLPEPGPHQVLVEVRAFGLNRTDLLQLRGKYPPPPGASSVLGLELAGAVCQVGEAVRLRKVGDRVAALVPGGAYAQYCLVEESHCLPLAENLSWSSSAALPEAWLTAYQALVWLAHTQPRERVLIHAAASGVGSAAIQVARQLGAEVFATCSPDKSPFCKNLGCSHIFPRGEAWRAQLEKAIGRACINVILDFIGPAYFEANINVLARDGRLVLLGLLSGDRLQEGLDFSEILKRRAQILASTLRNRSKEYQAELVTEFWRWAQPRFASGVMSPVIDSVMSVNELPQALERLRENKNAGKIVVSWQ